MDKKAIKAIKAKKEEETNTFFKILSSAGVTGVPRVPLLEGVPPPREAEAEAPLELGVEKVPLRTPRGVRGGEFTQGLQSKKNSIKFVKITFNTAPPFLPLM